MKRTVAVGLGVVCEERGISLFFSLERRERRRRRGRRRRRKEKSDEESDDDR
jgi:hypothetical protein